MEYVSDYIVPIGPEGLKTVNTGAWRTRFPVMNTEKCVKCGMCFMYCPVRAVIRKEDGSYEVTFDYCKGCGICARECKVNAIVMENVREGDE